MKKLLALVLALVMVMSLAVVTTSADYTDESVIDHQEAVDVMDALGIISGYPDGTFKPDNNVTRAEMAKMVTIAQMGDMNVTAFEGAATDLKDIDGHWAEAYIKYCVSQGIVSGRGNGIFDPDATVTTAEAAKMLLVALGYDAEVRGYVGGDWTLNVARDAQDSRNNLYKDIKDVTAGKAMDRDDAAQMIYNTLKAPTVTHGEEIASDGTRVTTFGYGNGNATLLQKTFKATEVNAYLYDVDYDADSGKYEYKFTNSGKNLRGNDTYLFGNTITVNPYNVGQNIESKTDYSDLFGQKVTVTYAIDDDSNPILLGLSSQAKVLAAGVVGQLDKDGAAWSTTATSVKLGDTVLKLDDTAGTTYVVSMDTTIGKWNVGVETNKVVNAPFPVKAIDNDDDGKVDVFVASPFAVKKVTYVGTDSIVAGSQTFNKDKDTGLYKSSGTTKANANSGLDVVGANEKFDFPADVKKDDFVKIDAGVSGKAHTVTVVAATQGKVVGERNGSVSFPTTALHKAQVGDTWLTDYTTFSGSYDKWIDSTYDFIVVNTFVFDADEVESASKEILLVESHAAGNTLDTARAKVMFSDGTVETINVYKVDDKKTTVDGGVCDDTLYTYKKGSDGYELTTVGATVLAGNDQYKATTYNATAMTNVINNPDSTNRAAKLQVEGRFGTTAVYAAVSDTAKIFVRDVSDVSNPEYRLLTGAQLKGYKTLSANQVYALLKDSDVQVAFIEATRSVGAEKLWVYIASDPTNVSYDDSVEYDLVTVYTQDGETKDIYVDKGSVTKNGIFGLTAKSNGAYEVASTGKEVAVVRYNESDKSIVAVDTTGNLYSNTYKVTNDTIVMNVDTDAKKGDKAGSSAQVVVANRNSANQPISNAMVFVDQQEGKLEAIVVDINNNWSNLAADAANVGSNMKFTFGTNIKFANVGTPSTYGTYYATTASTAVYFTYGNNNDTNAEVYSVRTDKTFYTVGDTITFTVEYAVTYGQTVGVTGVYIYLGGLADVEMISSGSNTTTKVDGKSGTNTVTFKGKVKETAINLTDDEIHIAICGGT